MDGGGGRGGAILCNSRIVKEKVSLHFHGNLGFGGAAVGGGWGGEEARGLRG